MTAVSTLELPASVSTDTAANANRHHVARSARYDSLDMWRGLACVLVVLYHSTLNYFVGTARSGQAVDGGLPGLILSLMHLGNIGVPMFFVISGYCISATARNAQERGTPLKTYFWRRFYRIYPPYWVAVMLLVAVYILFDVLVFPGVLSSPPRPGYRPWWFDGTQWLGNLTLTESWRHHIFGSPRGHILGQSWTLCYEEQFYLVVGVLLLFGSRAFFPLCAAVTLGSMAVQQVARANGVEVSGFFFDGFWLTFAFGIAVFYATNYLRLKGQSVICFILAVSPWLLARLPGLDKPYLAVAAGFAVLLLVLRPLDEYLKNARLLRPLFVCGTMCYSLYLVHSVLVAGISRACYWSGFASGLETLLVTIPLCLIGSLSAGWIFYLLVERRFMNSRQIASNT